LGQTATSKSAKVGHGFRQLGLLGVNPALTAACVALTTGTIAEKRAGNSSESNYVAIDGAGRRHQFRGAWGAYGLDEQAKIAFLHKYFLETRTPAIDVQAQEIQEIESEQEREKALDHFGLAGLSVIFASLWWFLTQGAGLVFSHFEKVPPLLVMAAKAAIHDNGQRIWCLRRCRTLARIFE
jgi:hypothetical protein